MVLLSTAVGGHGAPPHCKSTEQCTEENVLWERKNIWNLDWKMLTMNNCGSQPNWNNSWNPGNGNDCRGRATTASHREPKTEQAPWKRELKNSYLFLVFTFLIMSE